MIAWGIVMTLMGLVKYVAMRSSVDRDKTFQKNKGRLNINRNYHGLLIARIFLGVAEAGLFPGMDIHTNELRYNLLTLRRSSLLSHNVVRCVLI